MPTPAAVTSPSLPNSEILILCPSCQGSITAPKTMVGQIGECPFCHRQMMIEKPPAPKKLEKVDRVAMRGDLENLESQLRENVTQMTELRGHVSRLNNELHRHQIRMKSLTERQTELKTGISKARGDLGMEA